MLQPKSVTGADMAFGPKNIADYLPNYATVPDDFKRFSGNKWVDLTSKWFFSGLPAGTKFLPKPGIDADLALAHIRTCLASWDPKHEHKTAGVAFLLSEWFEDVEVPKD